MSEEFNLICRDTSNGDYHHSNRLHCVGGSRCHHIWYGKCVPHGRHCISDTQLLIVVCQADSEKLNFRLEQCYADSTAAGQQELYKHECNALDRPLWCHKGPQYLSYCLGSKPTYLPCSQAMSRFYLAAVEKNQAVRHHLDSARELGYSKYWNTVEPLYNGHRWESTFCPL